MKYLATILIVFCCANGFAQRYVYVNGVRLTSQQLQVLDLWACATIPNGNYWYNEYYNTWGYIGNPYAQGSFGSACNNSTFHQRRKSLSERGLLYSPGEILNR